MLLLPLTGYWIIFAVYGGMTNTRIYVHVMNGLGLLMIALFVFLYVVPYRGLRRSVAAGDWETGARRLAAIRRIVGTNLLLGLATIIIAAGGRYL